jgi:Restriction endonuclease
MAIPIFEDFLYPFLKFVGEKDMSTKEMRQAMINHFHLTEEDCDLTTRSGSTNQLADRLGWARQYLRRALLIDIPNRGTYRISERGKDYLTTHTDLRKKDLMEYPEFAAYANGSLSTPFVNIPDNGPSEPEVTPTELLESAYLSINKDLASELLQKILEQTPKFFEQLVLDLLRAMGYGTSLQTTPYVHDDGIDGIIFEDKLGLGRIYVQAKRYDFGNNVGKPAVQQFSGALDEQHSTKGIFITTSDYSREARSYVKTLPKSIVLVNGEELAKYMIEYNVGVSVKKNYEVKRIDIDYFEE